MGLLYAERVIVSRIQHDMRERDVVSRVAIYQRLLDDARAEQRAGEDEIAAQLGMTSRRDGVEQYQAEDR